MVKFRKDVKKDVGFVDSSQPHSGCNGLFIVHALRYRALGKWVERSSVCRMRNRYSVNEVNGVEVEVMTDNGLVYGVVAHKQTLNFE